MKENNKKDEVEKDDKKVISSENEKKLEEDIKESAAQENNDEAPENKNNNEESEDSVEKLFETIDLLKDEKLRLLAEMENLRKRSEKEKLDYIKYGSSNLARDILALDDNLARALESFDDQSKIKNSIENLIDGLKMVQKDFTSILEKHGIKKIEALNAKFDHNLHQAMLEIETDDHDEGIVVKEIQTGYTMHDRLLRPSMVGVSKKLKKV
tara:strand:+ start:661 stop:1293 length:633 start_codon:yes stop_codon:yes gene_type:complete